MGLVQGDGNADYTGSPLPILDPSGFTLCAVAPCSMPQSAPKDRRAEGKSGKSHGRSRAFLAVEGVAHGMV